MDLGKWKELLEELKEVFEKYRCGLYKQVPVSLDDRVNDFMEWYKVHINLMGLDEFSIVQNMRNFIEKVAVWYELRYPDEEVDKILFGTQGNREIDDVMFNTNPYINSIFDDNSEVRILDWSEFYNTKTFINSLGSEKRYFERPVYVRGPLYLDSNTDACVFINANGIIKRALGVREYTHGKIKGKEVIDMSLLEFKDFLKEKGIILENNNDIEKEIARVRNIIYQKEEMLNCIMYRIIERGGNVIGARRGFLFAKEFGRNIEIPMMYGVSREDLHLKDFLMLYLKEGGSVDLMCYVDYFRRTHKHDRVDVLLVEDLVKEYHLNDCLLASQIDEEKLERKLK